MLRLVEEIDKSKTHEEARVLYVKQKILSPKSQNRLSLITRIEELLDEHKPQIVSLIEEYQKKTEADYRNDILTLIDCANPQKYMKKIGGQSSGQNFVDGLMQIFIEEYQLYKFKEASEFRSMNQQQKQQNPNQTSFQI